MPSKTSGMTSPNGCTVPLNDSAAIEQHPTSSLPTAVSMLDKSGQAGPGRRPPSAGEKEGKFLNFDHVRFWVGNAKQAAQWYCYHLGFRPFAYQGLETGHRKVVSHVIKQNNITFVFESPLLPDNSEFTAFLGKHGDAVKDIAFTVEDLDLIVEKAKSRGATVVREIWEEKDKFGKVRFASIHTFGDVVHTLIDRSQYRGLFLPGYKQSPLINPTIPLPNPRLELIDHCVGDLPALQTEPVTKWYEEVCGMERFWSIDDQRLDTDFSSMRVNVVSNRRQLLLSDHSLSTSDAGTVQLVMVEPAAGKRGVSQAQEYLDFNGGSGVQHIAMKTNDIIGSITALRARGVEFLGIPTAYYDNLRDRLRSAKITVSEDLNALEKLHILIDFDDNGYLLQIFTKPVQDRPTLFLEIIQRHNYQGFGAGNFKALFEAVVKEQEKRGNLYKNNDAKAEEEMNLSSSSGSNEENGDHRRSNGNAYGAAFHQNGHHIS